MFNAIEYESILHEIKNSVCIIRGYLQLIEKQYPQVGTHRYWDSMKTDVDRLTCLFQDISDARAYEEIHPVSVAPEQFFSELKKDARALSSGKIAIDFEISPQLPALTLDPLRIHQALMNLIKNAFEAIETNGHILLSAGLCGQTLHIRVQDNGCGMDEERLSHIFKPMYTSKRNGTGLGLYLAQRIIEAHGGSLSCQSVPGEGTTFTAALPLA